MIELVVALLLSALIAGVLGFGRVAGAAAGLAKAAFFIFLLLGALALLL